jgi:hypothetical protein
MTTVYERNYRKLVEILGEPATWPESGTLKADGYMDLHFAVRERQGDAIVISLAHYYRQNGDAMSDPAMDLRVYPEHGMAEALTYEQHGIGNGIRRRVYLDDGRFFPRGQERAERLPGDVAAEHPPAGPSAARRRAGADKHLKDERGRSPGPSLHPPSQRPDAYHGDGRTV